MVALAGKHRGFGLVWWVLRSLVVRWCVGRKKRNETEVGWAGFPWGFRWVWDYFRSQKNEEKEKEFGDGVHSSNSVGRKRRK